MSLEEFRLAINNWPRNRKGRLLLPTSKREIIERHFRSANLSIKEFCSLTGLNVTTVSRILRKTKEGRRVERKRNNLFDPVKITTGDENTSWQVIGPGGLQVMCKNLSQLIQLWRALC